MELSKEIDDLITELESLREDNKRLIIKVQEHNSNINILNNSIKKYKNEIKSYKRLYENEHNERKHLMQVMSGKQEQIIL